MSPVKSRKGPGSNSDLALSIFGAIYGTRACLWLAFSLSAAGLAVGGDLLHFGGAGDQPPHLCGRIQTIWNQALLSTQRCSLPVTKGIALQNR